MLPEFGPSFEVPQLSQSAFVLRDLTRLDDLAQPGDPQPWSALLFFEDDLGAIVAVVRSRLVSLLRTWMSSPARIIAAICAKVT